MSAESIIFLVLAAVALVGAVGVPLARNPVHSVLFMLLTFANVAAMFLLLHAEFIAMVQIILYSGAILVLFLFVVMLLQSSERPLPAISQPLQAPLALLLGLALATELALVALASSYTRAPKGPDSLERIAQQGGNIEAIGRQLYTTWLLPFEIASVLLLVAAVGALYLAKEDI